MQNGRDRSQWPEKRAPPDGCEVGRIENGDHFIGDRLRLAARRDSWEAEVNVAALPRRREGRVRGVPVVDMLVDGAHRARGARRVLLGDLRDLNVDLRTVDQRDEEIRLGRQPANHVDDLTIDIGADGEVRERDRFPKLLRVVGFPRCSRAHPQRVVTKRLALVAYVEHAPAGYLGGRRGPAQSVQETVSFPQAGWPRRPHRCHANIRL